jgi:uncharacterized protein (TIGR02300 family)
MKDLGTKYVCYKCQAKFYDMKKPAPICPKCGADQREMPPPSKSERKKIPVAVAPKLEAVEDFEEEAPKDEDADEDAEPEEEDEP